MIQNNEQMLQSSHEVMQLPAIALRSLTILPSMIMHFDVSREMSIRAIDAALSGDDRIFLVTQKDSQADKVDITGVYATGTICRIKNITRMPHGLIRVMVEGLHKAQLLYLGTDEDFLVAGVEPARMDFEGNAFERDGMLRALKDLFQAYVQGNSQISKELVRQILDVEELSRLVEQISINIPLDYRRRQRLLDTASLWEWYQVLCDLLAGETEIGRIRSEIQRQVKERIDRHQKEYFLREQLKVIQEELGEDVPLSEAETFRERLQKLQAPEAIREKISKEISRFKSLGNNSAEASVSRNYIETLLDMPWEVSSEDSEDLRQAARILDEDHYGLEKVKERILEFLAVRQLTKRGESPILCLAGPPGTGKTSIARSVAKALNKKYVRISLGGVRDEAEIRGHRRTYIGAMPGRIISCVKNAGVNNPLMLLDEVDKLSSSYNGDPSSALLEVLDSEQNRHFTDHYLDAPFDLSRVLFIATANDLNTVPRPLLDRMEVIEVSSYTENEKLHIAKEHLLPKQKERHGIGPRALRVTDKALNEIIAGYTREAGVRQLERVLGELCRKTARAVLEDGKASVRVRGGSVEEFLGRKKYTFQKKNEKNEVGIVRGLAWTSVGGVTLQVEVNAMPGKGEMKLTGQLGDVMKESAGIALTYVRSIAAGYRIDPAYFQEHDIHVHIPAGAVPKDGPSAGITMAAAILSAAAGIPVRCDVAMTGEVTLRGRVLPIGGLKEKLLAAKNARMKTVIVPEENRKDVEELSEEITGGMEILYARTMEQVLETALAARH